MNAKNLTGCTCEIYHPKCYDPKCKCPLHYDMDIALYEIKDNSFQDEQFDLYIKF